MEDDPVFTATTTAEINPKTTDALAEQIKTEANVPRKLKRIAARSCKWNIPRSFLGYHIDVTSQAVGNARKWILRPETGDRGDFYIVKYPSEKWGDVETYTELLINQLGAAFGFEMAHSGVARLDGELVFVTRSFLNRDEHLIHGSFLIEEYWHAKGELDSIHRSKEQEFYSVDFVLKTIEDYCGEDGPTVINRFVEMLVFDALIGSNDRHPQNWGVIRASKTQGGYRLAPIFDTARALLWNTSDAKLTAFQKDERLLRNHIARAKPIVGPERTFLKARGTTSCNHFEFLANLFAASPHLKVTAVTKVPSNLDRIAASLVQRSFPFRGAFNRLRRETILKLLSLRADELIRTLQKGGTTC